MKRNKLNLDRCLYVWLTFVRLFNCVHSCGMWIFVYIFDGVPPFGVSRQCKGRPSVPLGPPWCGLILSVPLGVAANQQPAESEPEGKQVRVSLSGRRGGAERPLPDE